MSLLAISWDVSPILFELGTLSIRWYGLMFVMGFVFALKHTTRVLKSENKPVEWADKLLWYCILGTLAGARLGHVIFYDPQMFSEDFINVFLPISFQGGFHFTGYQGLASHGGAIGVFFAMLLYRQKVNKKPFLWTFDRIAMSVAILASLIRIGNLMNSEIYGDTTSLPWGFIFVRSGETLPKHPTQLYEALAYAITGILLTFLFWKTKAKKKRGLITGLSFILIFGSRFLIEFVKEEQVGWESGMISHIGLNQGQMLSIPFVVVGIWLVIKAKKKNEK